MTAETIKTEGRPAPAYRKPTQTRAGRLRQEMIDSYIAALGGNVGPIVMQDVIRVADLTLLASHQRAELAGGRAKIADVVKLEGTLARAMKRLNLPEPNAAAPDLLHDHAAKRALERANPPEEAD